MTLPLCSHCSKITNKPNAASERWWHDVASAPKDKSLRVSFRNVTVKPFFAPSAPAPPELNGEHPLRLRLRQQCARRDQTIKTSQPSPAASYSLTLDLYGGLDLNTINKFFLTRQIWAMFRKRTLERGRQAARPLASSCDGGDIRNNRRGSAAASWSVWPLLLHQAFSIRAAFCFNNKATGWRASEEHLLSECQKKRHRNLIWK